MNSEHSTLLNVERNRLIGPTPVTIEAGRASAQRGVGPGEGVVIEGGGQA
jgi:hypothetical protein